MAGARTVTGRMRTKDLVKCREVGLYAAHLLSSSIAVGSCKAAEFNQNSNCSFGLIPVCVLVRTEPICIARAHTHQSTGNAFALWMTVESARTRL